MNTLFKRVLAAKDKATTLRESILRKEQTDDGTFVCDQCSFSQLPGSPYSYWVSDSIRRLFSALPSFESENRAARVGLQTSDDFRFVRAWWSTRSLHDKTKWFPFAKGGEYSPYFAALPLAVNWSDDGREAKAWIETLPGTSHWTRYARSADKYGTPGLTWPLRAPRFAPQPLPSGSVFSVRGYSAFAPLEELAATMAILNSSTFDYLFKTTLGRHDFPEFVVGVLQRMPWKNPLDSPGFVTLSTVARRAWSIKRTAMSSEESSRYFVLPALLQPDSKTFEGRVEALRMDELAANDALIQIQTEIDELAFGLYGVESAERTKIQAATGNSVGAEESDAASCDSSAWVAELFLWSIGVAFGRFDLRLVTGERAWPEEPEPFDPLPVCSPGMLQDAEGRPATEAPEGYPIDFSASGILVDDPGHGADIRRVMESVFDHLGPKHPKSLWDEAQEQLGRGGLEKWLRKDCFGEHLDRYSKGRRQAPIFWQLGTPSAEYSVWLYYHRANKDTLYQVLNDYVKPKLSDEKTRLGTLVQEGGQTPSPAQRREIETQEKQVEELRAMRDDVERSAPLWSPNLDDGVIINAAPLWRLFGHTKKWQKACYDCWEKLALGDYDWSHLGMHLWPERVVPKCANDRSLAIAHGLEEAFWIEDSDGKWSERKVSQDEVQRLIEERSSDAVAAARDALVALPGPNKPRKRKR